MKLKKRKSFKIILSLIIISSLLLGGYVFHERSIKRKQYTILDEEDGSVCHYIDTNGNIVDCPPFSSYGDFNDDGVAYVEAYIENGLGEKKTVYGYIDKSFNFINDKYWELGEEGEGFEVEDDNNGIYLRRIPGENGDIIIVMDEELNELSRIENVEINSGVTCDVSDNGLILLEIITEDGNYDGFINKHGKWVIEPKYTRLSLFYDGLAAARLDGKEGLINEEGEWVVEPKYKDIDYGEDCSYFRALLDEDTFVYINKEGELLNDGQYNFLGKTSNYHDGLCVFYDEESGLIGYKNEDMEWIIPPQFINAYSFENGFAQVSLEVEGKERWGYIDKEGNFLFDCQFTYGRPFTKDGIAGVEVDGLWGFVKSDGTWLFEPQFVGVGEFHNGYGSIALRDGQSIDSN